MKHYGDITQLHGDKLESEIDPFPQEVCKYHFGDEETGEEGDIEKYMHKGETNA